MADKSLRDNWKEAKAKAAKGGVDMKAISDNLKFGPKLDKFEAELKAYDQLTDKLARNPDPAKEKAAKKKVMDAAKAAFTAGRSYLAALQVVEKGTTGAAHKAAYDLGTVLGMDILDSLEKIATGKKHF